MNGYRSVGPVEIQPVGQETKDELRRFVEPHLLDLVLHAVKAGALVAKDRVAALLTGLPKSLLQFGCLPVGDLRHTLAFPDRTATKGRHILREYDLVARFAQQRHHLLDKRLVHGVVMLRKPHNLVDAAREIDYLADGRHSCDRFGCLRVRTLGQTPQPGRFRGRFDSRSAIVANGGGTYQSPERFRNIIGLRGGRSPKRNTYGVVQPAA